MKFMFLTGERVAEVAKSGGKKRAEDYVDPLWGDRKATDKDVVRYRILMKSVNSMTVSKSQWRALYRGASVIEGGITRKDLPLWVLRKFERWIELWYGKGGVIGFPEKILLWADENGIAYRLEDDKEN